MVSSRHWNKPVTMRPIINYDFLCGGSQVQIREMSVGQKQLCKAVDCAVRFLYIDTGEIQLAKKKSDKSTIVKSIPSSETGARTGCKTKSGREIHSLASCTRWI